MGIVLCKKRNYGIFLFTVDWNPLCRVFCDETVFVFVVDCLIELFLVNSLINDASFDV